MRTTSSNCADAGALGPGGGVIPDRERGFPPYRYGVVTVNVFDQSDCRLSLKAYTR